MPLNELFLSSMYLYANDVSVIANVASNVILGKNNSEVQIGKNYISQLNGSIKIICEIPTPTSGAVYVSVRNNNKDVIELTSGGNNYSKSQTIDVKKGDVISFYAKFVNKTESTPVAASVNSVQINGQVGFAPKGEIFKIEE